MSHKQNGLPSTCDSLSTVAFHQKPCPLIHELWTILLTHETQLEYFDSGFTSKLVDTHPPSLIASQPNQSFFFLLILNLSSDSHEHCGCGGWWRGHGRGCSGQWPFTFPSMNFPSNPNLASYDFYSSCQNFEPPFTSHGLLRPAPMNMFSQSQLSLLHAKFTINMAILHEILQPDITLLWVWSQLLQVINTLHLLLSFGFRVILPICKLSPCSIYLLWVELAQMIRTPCGVTNPSSHGPKESLIKKISLCACT